jgi:hypothetical protein
VPSGSRWDAALAAEGMSGAEAHPFLQALRTVTVPLGRDLFIPLKLLLNGAPGLLSTLGRTGSNSGNSVLANSRRKRDATMKFATARVFFHVNSIFVRLATEATSFPLAEGFGSLPRPNFATRPPFAKTLNAHTVTRLASAHAALSIPSSSWDDFFVALSLLTRFSFASSFNRAAYGTVSTMPTHCSVVGPVCRLGRLALALVSFSSFSKSSWGGLIRSGSIPSRLG